MAAGTTHVIGAGLAGLAGAVKLGKAGRRVIVHELARHAGGRCRSYFEPALGLTIDNGNHLLLSGNRAALNFLETIGSRHLVTGPDDPEFTFCDYPSGERWTVRPNAGVLPWWIFSTARRVPGSRARDYLGLARLMMATPSQKIGDVIDCDSDLYHRLWRPVLLAALNSEPDDASAALAGAVIRETLARGGNASRPLIAANGLGPALIDPAITFIERHGGAIRFDCALRGIEFSENRAANLVFSDGSVGLGAEDNVIVAVPAWVARTLIPGLEVPNAYRAILNAHFKITPPAGSEKILGVIGAITEWLFAFDDRLSVTVSAADRFLEADREPLAREIWAEVSKLTGLMSTPLPPWQIVKERRATFAALPAEDAKRPGARTQWRNVLLAGDWTATGLPATIEGSIRSGETAANLVNNRF